MSTLDSHQTVVDLMRVPGAHELYILGCFARHVTIYSQQVRALNLALALAELGRLSPGTRVVVIGAGAAGLTAAAALARLGAQVLVLEKLRQLMGFQRGAHHRFVHPHINSWPFKPLHEQHADLPVLSWSADWASQVAHQISAEWDDEVERAKGNLELRCEARRVNVDTAADPRLVQLTWHDAQYGLQHRYFEIAILAVGYGVEETEGLSARRYWEADTLDTIDAQVKKCLISGAGDGGLTDLMRLCFRDFRHDRVLELFARAETSAILRRFFEAARAEEGRGATGAVDLMLQRLNHEPLVASLLTGTLLRTDREVYLTSRTVNDVYGPGASLINRFIVSQLARARAWTWIDGPLVRVNRMGGKYSVIHGRERRSSKFDMVVVRHGTTPALESDFPRIWEQTSGLRTKWTRMGATADTTCIPGDFSRIRDARKVTARIDAQLPSLTPAGGAWRPKLVAFDLDGTLIQGNDFVWSWRAVWKHLGYSDHDHSTVMNKYLSLQGQVSNWYRRWCEEAAVHFRQRGLRREQLREISARLYLADDCLTTIRALKEGGIRTAIISGGMDSMLEDLIPNHAELFDDVFINRLKFDTHGNFMDIVPTEHDFHGKFDAIKLLCKKYGLAHSEALFVGDGFHDEALPANVQVAVINASSYRLKTTAQIPLGSLSGLLTICLAPKPDPAADKQQP